MRPLTGKPDAGNPPVRFGGRGAANAASLPLSERGVCSGVSSERRKLKGTLAQGGRGGGKSAAL